MAPKAVSLVTFTARMTGKALVIRVFSASNLPDKDGMGKSDPYVKVICGGHKEKTKVGKNYKNPVYDPAKSTFSFPVESPEAGIDLELEVWDKDTLSSDDLIGKASVVLTPSLLMAADSGCLLSLPLTGKGLAEDPTLHATPGAYDYQAYSDEEDYSEWYFITAANGLVVEAHEYGLFLAHRTGGDRQLWCLNSDGSLESRCGAFATVVEGDDGKLQVIGDGENHGGEWVTEGNVLRSVSHDLVLDIDEGIMEPGSRLILWEHHGGDNQMFEIVQA